MIYDYAVILNGVVVNVIRWDGETDYTPPEGTMLVRLEPGYEVGIGWTYSNREFTAPTSPPPSRHP